MNLSQLKSIYAESQNSIQIGEALQQGNARIHLKGLAGSIDSLIASGVSSVLNGNYLYVLRDKEEAAYFYNNLENITKGDKGVSLLFYPASYKRPYQIEAIDNANVIQRTEVLNVVRKKRKNILLVTYPEAIIENVVTKKEFEKNTLELEVGIGYEIDFINELLIE